MVVTRAVVCSIVAHAAALAAMAVLWSRSPSALDLTLAGPDPAVDTAAAAVAVDEPARATTTIELRSPGDARLDVAEPAAPTAAPNPDPAAGAAASSSGRGAGAPALVTARADRVTVRAQPYDAAAGYQLARVATETTRQSREQVRATPHPAPTPWLASRDGAGHGRDERHARAVDSTPARAAEADRAPPRRAAQSVAGRARPDVERNPAATDAATPSERVADRVDQALVSDEPMPDRLELTRPSAPGRERDGRGDGALGFSPHAAGAAPVPTGAPGLLDARALALATFQRAYDRYLQEVRRKVDPLWEFPRELAVKLLQGDVLVGFTVRKDGTLKDVRVLKPSGFPSFDDNVLAAIRKAAPFSPLPETLGAELRITAPFEAANPVIR